MYRVSDWLRAGFVGLKNGGATCYMNSVIQQMFMIPGVVDSVLSVDDSDENNEDTKTYARVNIKVIWC